MTWEWVVYSQINIHIDSTKLVIGGGVLLDNLNDNNKLFYDMQYHDKYPMSRPLINARYSLHYFPISPPIFYS